MEDNYSDIALARYFSGESSPEERLQVDAWKEASQANKEAFEAARFIWERSLEIGSLDFNTENALSKVHNLMKNAAEKKKSGRTITPYAWIAAVAAAILIPLFFILRHAENPSLQNREYTTISSGSAIKALSLADGSKVWLNRNSHLQIPKHFKGDLFEISLDGEAYFQIAHHPQCTFRINTSNNQVEVLGTAFNLKASGKETIATLAVTDGKVLYRQKSMATEKIIEKGQMAISDASRKTITTAAIGDENFLSWKTRVIRFRNTPLKTALHTLNEYYHVNFSLADTQLNHYPVTSTFVDLPVEEAVKILNLASDSIAISKDKTGYRVIRK